jgi:predicted PurR-regulated permease PerM
MSRVVEFIEKLQEKPKNERKRIMWFSVVVCMLLIFVFWVFALKTELKNNTGAPVVPQEVTDSVKQVQNQLPAVKSNLQNMKAGINSLFEGQSGENSPFEQK